MQHLNDGMLRRLYDEPLALSAAQRQHYTACDRCRERFAAIAAEARLTARHLSVPAAPVDSAAAYARLQQRLAAEGHVPARRAMPRWYDWYERIITMMHMDQRRLVKPVGGVVAAAALVGALALTPAGSFAQSLLTIFEPQQIAVVPLTPADLQGLRNLPDLSSYGTMTTGTQPSTSLVADAAAARAATGLPVRLPTSLPAGVPRSVSYAVMSQGTASFTFSAAKARAAADRTGKPLPAMPASLDGSTLQVTIGPAVVATYGGNMAGAIGGRGDAPKLRLRPKAVVRAAARSSDELPTLVVAQAAVPQVTSTGASVQEIENYLLAQPGVSPQLAAEIRSIGDPSTTLPIPLPINRATAQKVQIDGVTGWAIGDNTGVGSAVIWVKGHTVYGVAGSLPEDQVLAAAGSLQ